MWDGGAAVTVGQEIVIVGQGQGKAGEGMGGQVVFMKNFHNAQLMDNFLCISHFS